MTTVPISMNSIMRGQLRFMNCYFDIIGVSSYVKKDIDEIKKREGIRMETVEMKRTISLLQDFIALIRLIILFKKEKPDIVHTHTPKAGLLGMVAAKMAGVKLRLHTVAGMPLMETSGLKKEVLKMTERITYRMASRVYPNANGLLEYIVNEGLSKRSKLKIIGKGASNGVDTNYFNSNYKNDNKDTIASLAKTYGIDQGKDKIFIFIGRLAKDKGIKELVLAFEKLDEGKGIKLLLLGPIEKTNSALGIDTLTKIENNENIIYPGRTDDIRPYLSMSNFFVFPSYREGFPNVLLQAGSMKIPILASRINGCVDIVPNEEYGILFEHKSSSDLLSAMRKILETDEKEIQKWTKNVNQLIVNNFSNSILWNAIRSEYDYLVSQ